MKDKKSNETKKIKNSCDSSVQSPLNPYNHTMTDKQQTPRTDAVFWSFHTKQDLENLARELELENIQLRKELEALKTQTN
jgi:hypothetical protein